MRDLILYDHRSSICSQMARLALVEKELNFARRQIDIMDTNEQFEDWYIALNPRAVVPTLKIGDEVVTDTIRIVNRVQSMAGPDLAGDATTQAWLTDIMALHYGVLMYRNRIDETGTAPQIVARGRLLNDMLEQRPDLSDLIAKRLEGNRRFQALLKSPSEIETHLETSRALVGRLNDALQESDFIAGPAYSLADCFATAALARFTIHGFDDWWRETALDDYYARMKARPSFEGAEVVETGTERDL